MQKHAVLSADHTAIYKGSTETKTSESFNWSGDKQQRELAQYISDMILELRNMARSAKLFHVMVPLEYAYYEAYSVANRVHVPATEIERLRNLEKAAADENGLESS